MTNNTATTESTTGFGYGFVLFVVFFVLKLTGTIHWSWWFVTMPLYATWVASVAIVIAWPVVLAVLFALTQVIRLIYTGIATVLAYPILWWERGQNKRIAGIYAKRSEDAWKNAHGVNLSKPT